MGEREEPEGGVDSSCGPGVVGVTTRRLEPRRESPGDLRFSRLGEVFCRNSLVHIHIHIHHNLLLLMSNGCVQNWNSWCQK